MRCFDAIWSNQRLAENNQSSPSQKVRLSDVMAVDASIDRRQSAKTSTVHEQMALIEESIKNKVA
jgi:hypothetical protein